LLENADIPGMFYILSLSQIQSDDINSFVSTLQRNSKSNVVKVNLPPLDAVTIHKMVANSLQVDLETCEPLYLSLYPHSRGNPRCLIAQLKWMYHNHHLLWDKSRDSWHWEIHQLLQVHHQISIPRTIWDDLPAPIQKILQGA
jgi:predicted ATPase